MPVSNRSKQPGHVLYKNGDVDAPESIRDSNGEVVLGLCRRCGKAERELVEPCVNSQLAARMINTPRAHDNDYPLWQGPCADGPLGGVTQSMLVRFLSCRERFRLRYICGLEPMDRWNHRLGYGNMWHVCEQHHAMNSTNPHLWQIALHGYTIGQVMDYPLQREEIEKWYSVCRVQFPEYVNYWAEHPDVVNRTPLMQEQVFDVPYQLPSGRVARLRGRWDSVDLIDGGIYLQENKTKGDIDRQQVERQLSFDLQTMMYATALTEKQRMLRCGEDDNPLPDNCDKDFKGVRYNVVRRPLSGGKGNIKPHSGKSTKSTYTPPESDEEFYERLRRDYIAAEPDYWFFRVRAEISARDIDVFRRTCLDPVLEQVCDWYDHITGAEEWHYPTGIKAAAHWRTPFGVWSSLEEGGSTEYDAYLATGSEAGLRRVEELFVELKG